MFSVVWKTEQNFHVSVVSVYLATRPDKNDAGFRFKICCHTDGAHRTSRNRGLSVNSGQMTRLDPEECTPASGGRIVADSE